MHSRCDDDPDLMAFLFAVLIDDGFSIMAANHGQQALDLLERGLRPHVILIDLKLPRVSGVDVLNHIRADGDLRTIPRIVMTGSTERAGIVADAVFEKPFDHHVLLETIHRLVATDESPAVGAGVSRPAARRASADDRSRSRKHGTPRRSKRKQS